MHDFNELVSENILQPLNILPYGEQQVWSIYTTSHAMEGENVGYIMAKDILHGGDPVCITKDPGCYGATKSVTNGDRMWVVYTKYKQGKKCIYLSRFNKDKVQEHVMVTDFGKVDNPDICIHNGLLFMTWEDYKSGRTQIKYKTVKMDTFDQKADNLINKESQVLTSQEERAYKPTTITDGRCLYVAYESFYNKRYHLVMRCLHDQQESFSEPYEIGFSERNDQEANMCLHEGKVLVTWENSSPLDKGYIWIDHEGKEIRMPGFGHGWKVYTRIGLRRVSFVNGEFIIEDLSNTGDIAPVIEVNAQESSGCPKVFIDGEGNVFIAYLAWAGGWGIKIKYLKDGKWVDMGDTGLIQKQRVAPAVLMEQTNNRLYVLGHRIELENKIWTYENNSTWIRELSFDNPESYEPYSFVSHICNPTAIHSDNDNKGKSIEYKDQKLKLFWGDIHMHSNLSGCSLHPKFHCTELDEKFRFSRDVGSLDFAMITDHDSMSEYEWNMTKEAGHFNNIHGHFTAFEGFEWTCTQNNDKQNYGHYNILYRESGSLYKTTHELYRSIERVWDDLEKDKALTIPHHPGCNAHPLDWNYFNSDFVPLVEIFQVRGSYEYDMCELHPENYGRGVLKNNSVQVGLGKGYRIGFTSGGEHEGVGVTAVYAESLTRDSIFEALKKRHVYGTTGDRICVDFRLNDKLMGSEVVTKNTNPMIKINIEGTSNIDSVKVIRNGECIKEWNPKSQNFNVEWVDNSLTKEKKDYYYYLTAKQDNNEMAWASPVFLTKE